MHVKQGLTLPMLLLILMGLLMGVQVQWPNAMVRATTIIVLLFSSVFSSVMQPIPLEEGIWDAKWNADGTLLAVANPDGRVYLYDVDRKLVRNFPAHERRVYAVSWSPDGTVLSTSGWDYFLRFWQVDTGDLLHEINTYLAIGTLDWQGKYIVAGAGDTLGVWDTTTYKMAASVAGTILDVKWSPDGSSFAVGTMNAAGIAKLNGAQIEGISFLIDDESVNMRTNSVAWSQDGTQVISTHEDEGIYIWDANTAEMKYRVYKSDETFYDAVFVGEASEQVVAITQEGRIYTFDAATGEIVETLETEAFLWALAWNPIFNLVAIGGTIYDLNTTRANNVKTTGFLSLHPITNSD